ncbi:MAG TPA: 50S ribosomal protein L11 methyltransferase [Acidothermaceae bacterium]
MPDVEHYIAVCASTQLLPVPLIPEIVLYAAENAYEVWDITRLGKDDAPVPYWSFPWAGGQALARHLLDHPDLVRDRRVLDLAAGSGLVAIAAMKAGARSAVANDVDSFAAAAQELNARANQVAIDVVQRDLLDRDVTLDQFDLVVAGDVCYQPDLAERLVRFLRRAKANGVGALLADPGRAYLPRDGLDEVAAYEVPTALAIEGVERKATTIWTPRV